MENVSGLLGPIILVLMTLFMFCPVLALTISLFTSQKKFARTMIEKAIVSEEDVKILHPKKQIAGVIITLLLLVVLVSVCVKTGWTSVLCTAIALAVGMVKNRNIIPITSFTVSRFKKTYAGKYDEKKLNKYISETFK